MLGGVAGRDQIVAAVSIWKQVGGCEKKKGLLQSARKCTVL